MPDPAPPADALTALEAENARLRRIAEAAKEALALLEGRRPGFTTAYARDVLRTAFSDDPIALTRPIRRYRRRAKAKTARAGGRKKK